MIVIGIMIFVASLVMLIIGLIFWMIYDKEVPGAILIMLSLLGIGYSAAIISEAAGEFVKILMP